jgi:hypothetical protein
MPALLWLALAAGMATTAGAANAADKALTVPHLSGQQFLDRQFDSASTPREDRENKTVFNQQYARGYLAGVADASRGSAWCEPATIRPAELETAVLSILKKLSQHELRQDAAVLIMHALRQRFPCR